MCVLYVMYAISSIVKDIYNNANKTNTVSEKIINNPVLK